MQNDDLLLFKNEILMIAMIPFKSCRGGSIFKNLNVEKNYKEYIFFSFSFFVCLCFYGISNCLNADYLFMVIFIPQRICYLWYQLFFLMVYLILFLLTCNCWEKLSPLSKAEAEKEQFLIAAAFDVHIPYSKRSTQRLYLCALSNLQ